MVQFLPTVTFYYMVTIHLRYDPLTGIFTVPSGGSGVYYIHMSVTVASDEWAYFNVRRNGDIWCTAVGDVNGYQDYPVASCGVVIQLAEGEKL